MTRVTVHVAKTQLSRLIARALAGEEVIIARGSTPVARLVPLHSVPTGRRPGTLKGRLRVTEEFFAPLPPSELARWGK